MTCKTNLPFRAQSVNMKTVVISINTTDFYGTDTDFFSSLMYAKML